MCGSVLFNLMSLSLQCREQLMKAVMESVDVVLRPSLLDQLHQYFPIQVQKTDRFAQTLLKLVLSFCLFY